MAEAASGAALHACLLFRHLIIDFHKISRETVIGPHVEVFGSPPAEPSVAIKTLRTELVGKELTFESC